MIQRIQSAYLALVLAISVSLFLIPLSVITNATDQSELSSEGKASYIFKVLSVSNGNQENQPHLSTSYLLIILNGTIAIVTAIAIFLFKDRKKQRNFCRFILVGICLFAGVVFWMEDQLKKSTGGNITYLIGSYLPVIQLILTYLAERAIKKDDDLVKSADRLR